MRLMSYTKYVLATLLMLTALRCFALTDLAQAPIGFLLSTPVKPNIYFILDDSGSMAWSFLGDEVVAQQYQNTVGYRSSLCNKIYYNPTVRYPVPVNADGSEYPQQNFFAALYDGFQPGSMTINLSEGFMAWRSNNSEPASPRSTSDVSYRIDCATADSGCTVSSTGLPNRPEPAHYFAYIGNKPEHLGDGSDQDHCRDTALDSGSPTSNNWRKVIVSTSSGPSGGDETINFANWFSYHRTRLLTMKTAVGRAFSQLDGNFRVGYSTISESGVSDSSDNFLRIDDFAGEHRNTFYKKLYAARPTGGTPLRAALAKAGRLYAGKLLTGSNDPLQYACQQNTTILSTDGYWTSQDEFGSYAAKQIDGITDVGNPDAQLPRPMFDGGAGARPARMATLTVEPRHTDPDPWYSVLISLKVNNINLMNNFANILHKPGANVMTEAAELAYWISLQIARQGYRAFAKGNQVFILAPASAGEVSATPAIESDGSFPYSVTPFTEVTGAGRATNTLADVAAWYFENDLRTSALGNCGPREQLCENTVPVVPGRRSAAHQHMVTHTLGLGANGTLRYREDYESAAEGDFQDILRGNKDWPDPIYAPAAERIDDLWHTAVNGGGRYFSARSPESLANALSASLSAIRAATGAAAASASSSQEPAEGDNLLFSSRYRSLYWDGELEARRIALSDGSLSDRIEWSAAALLQQSVNASTDNRKIFIASTSISNGLKNFRWDELSSTERQLFAGCSASESARFEQCAQLSDTERAQAAGKNLVDYLRGQFQYEDRPDNTLRLFRKREQILGAPINAQPVYVGAPAFRYADLNYGEYRDQVAANRPATVYLAANDGMLHAFDAASGKERWAFIPESVLPQLWRLADNAYSKNFRYLLDGTPVVGDICPLAPGKTCTAEEWRTILVAGLGAAGREFYALDITQAEQPKLLWRINADTEPQLGYALGKPIITKRRDGTWVVLITSGYNNVTPGDGRGVLFVVNASQGEVIKRIDTGAGTTTQPAGLAQLNAWVEDLLDNTVERIYGGDLLGNVWRFDINEASSNRNQEAVLLARLVRNGNEQPITTRPELSLVRIGNQSLPVISIGTGRYLGQSDINDKSVQSVYTFRDYLSTNGLGDVRQRSSIVQKRLTTAGDTSTRGISDESVDWLVNDGWYVDLDAQTNSGERIVLDPEQQLGMLSVVSNVPDSNACRPRAESWSYAFNYINGNYLPMTGSSWAGRRVSSASMVAGARLIRVGRQVVSIFTDDSGKVSSIAQPANVGRVPSVRRVAWRELEQQ
ncbi:MAG: hypothetical protein EBW14_01130 [Oxalobacteraceae bacterium]|nr:hypothetical protein [Oxalobacteraceae bacterium]